VDLPGVQKKDIKLTSKQGYIELKADGCLRTYEGRLDIPQGVEEDPEKVTYVNGVLELIYKKSGEGRDIHVQ